MRKLIENQLKIGQVGICNIQLVTLRLNCNWDYDKLQEIFIDLIAHFLR